MFDHLGRKKQAWERINGGTNVLISQTDYNELGQLMNKHLHSENGASPFLQDFGYTYNERGWLRTQGSSNNLFSLDLRYNTPDNGISAAYNGNIAEMLYTGTNSGAKVFRYQYDPINRLTSAVSTGGTLNETVSYDVMGNITGLTRQGGSAAVLAYSYLNGGLSNQLQVVTKGGGAYKSYAYDGNGNATSNGGSKGISYNLLNLPLNIKTGGTTLATYVYDAEGNKLRNTGTDGTWDYINGIVYNNKILFVQTEEGRALPNGNIYLYQYYLKDHLGNTRVTFTKNSSGIATNIQENEYYAFGLAAAVPSTPSPANRYLYNGKEIQTDLASQYDYGARFYDPVIGRFTTLDPLAEKMRRWSPYAYGFGNPLRFIEKDGMAPEDIVINGSAAFQTKAFNDLQKNSSSQLVLLSNGQVKEQSHLGEDYGLVVQTGTPSGLSLPIGTNLVASAINSQYTNTISETTGPGNVTTPTNMANAQGVGTTVGSGVDIKYNPSATGATPVQVPGGVVPAIQNADGTTGRPSNIGLAHELVHTQNANNGKVASTTPTNALDPDSQQRNVLSQEEINTRVIDSQIRKEQKVPERAQPQP